jgi:hypothetical protein
MTESEQLSTVRYFFDTEFIEYPCTIDLVSIGIISDDGREFYAESSEVDWSKAHPWVLENVLPHLTGPKMPRTEIAERINAFVTGGTPEFWAYYADYDWVVFCWLWGGMIDLPRRFPHLCMDLQQLARSKKVGYLPDLVSQEGTHHNALEDARWNRAAFYYVLHGDEAEVIAESKTFQT